MEDEILKFINISKKFPGIIALDNVSFSIKENEVHAIVGENGAGKSTLIKIISGIYQNYDGKIELQGKETKIESPLQAEKIGISTIFQELTIVPELSVVENIFLGKEQKIFNVFINRSSMIKDSKQIMKLIGCEINPLRKAGELSIASQQLIEILKALIMDTKIIVMDEPTASLSKFEVEQLFNYIKILKNNKKTIIFVSHRLEEVFEIADTITVLRDGKYIGTERAKEVKASKVVSMIAGRPLDKIFPKRESKIGNTILEINGLSRINEFNNINFELKEGEILGFAGLVGSGRTEVAKAICGITKPNQGKIVIFGQKLKRYFKNPGEALKKGIGYLPEDRKSEGLFYLLSVGENITTSVLKRCLNFNFFINSRKEDYFIKKYIQDLNIKIRDKYQKSESLSGGNQQKLIISRILATEARVLFFDEPTKGIDVGAKTEIYNIMSDLVKEGISIIYISSDLEELLGVADRVILFRNGKIIKDIDRKEFSAEKIIGFLTGSNLYENNNRC